ncbi:MAG: VCBS repeat-containing protein [Pyrinomonadaceae bacterium]
MFFTKNRKNLSSRMTMFTLLAVTVFCCAANIVTTNAQVVRKNVPLDFTGDDRTDWATIANFTAPAPIGTPLRWKILGNPASATPNAAFKRDFDYGLRGDIPVPRDYTGDRKTEVAVYRRGTPGIYYVSQFPTGVGGITLERAVPWGQTGDRLGAEGDYDGDGKVDYTVVRRDPTTGNLTWFILSSSTGTQRAFQFGSVPTGTAFIATEGADFNADGRDEVVLATFTPSTGAEITFYIGDANTGAGVLTVPYGDFDTDFVITPADYTGDGRADIVVARATDTPITWYIRNTATGATTAFSFGIGDPNFENIDLPIRGDYDGDGRHDIAVYRPSNQTFYYLRSSNNNTIVDGQRHGDPGDFPLGALGTF